MSPQMQNSVTSTAGPRWIHPTHWIEIYAYLPLMWRVLRKISAIVREA